MEQGSGRVLKLARGRSAIWHGLLQYARGTLDRLEAEVGDVDMHLEAEHQRLVRGWRQLEVAVNFSRFQHAAACSKDEECFATAKESHNGAFEEAKAADLRCEAVERHEQELLVSALVLERRVRELEAIAPTPTRGPLIREAGLRALEESLELVALEQNLEHDRLEVMECQVITAEAALASREAKVQVAIDEGVAGALAKDYRKKLKLQKTRFCARRNELTVGIDTLKKQLAGADRCKKAALEAQASVEAELASLHPQVGDVASLVK